MARIRRTQSSGARRKRSVSFQSVSIEVLERGDQVFHDCKQQMASVASMIEENRVINTMNRQTRRTLDTEKQGKRARLGFIFLDFRENWGTQMRSDDAAVNFIEIEFSVCEFNMGLSLNADHKDAQERYVSNARDAHNAIARFLPRLRISLTEMNIFQRRLASLTAKLGEHTSLLGLRLFEPAF